ncbi:hypothetical protein L1D19_05835 [Vibrio natriegens]|uniref:immunoglobulin domain-containing protein n=1 Tax=Vibrio natriegens TaxID=691 RepID=UPI001EFDBB4D|nr:immunoglobulin domain-containing protein [Vibrio natriegens]MCG9699652.1 hypothetical protein [Vibrio natriegens]
MALFFEGEEILTLRLEGELIETLRVEGEVVARKPIITTQPVGSEIGDDESITLSVVADGLGSTLTYQWYKSDGTAISGATGTSYTFEPTTTGSFGFYCRVTGFGGYTQTDTANVVVETSLPDLILETVFIEDGSITLASDCIRIEAQGCGGGGGGGTGSKSVYNKSGGGGGGAALLSELISDAIGGQFLSVTVGIGGNGGASGENGYDGTSSLIEGTDINMVWAGGFGGEAGVTASESAEVGRGANGGNNSNGEGGALGNSTDEDAPDSVIIGGGGAGGRYTYDAEVYDKPDTPSDGGDGGGSNGGDGGVPPQGDGWAGKSGGGGGGGNEAAWWDGEDAGRGADGGANGANGVVNDALPATGYGNGGGGGHGSGSSDKTKNGLGSAGSGGRIVLRQYRR